MRVKICIQLSWVDWLMFSSILEAKNQTRGDFLRERIRSTYGRMLDSGAIDSNTEEAHNIAQALEIGI